ncbi:hypothetical protein TGAM01_v205251 [Trichoderma gamsii]|uniref:Uncharacterized protein n=1 Tax=Trichoderma gamsii TaxID=398673 RepID=A0A2P4ZNH8_9HYPO|nr:hypothetical protein TGAM01_v205251 [Trichoderma gamsii]PON25814.1 hypothetical protein TGAM01_v205251 [Trichoderma gamsii]
MSSYLITLVTAAISLAAISGASQCYLPDGHLAGDYGFNFEPCNGKNTTWQQCCFPGDICTRNGLYLPQLDCCYDGSAQYHLSDNSRAKTGADTSGEVGGKKNRATIGAVVGGALGGLALIGGAVGVWLYLRKKRNMREKESAAQNEISGLPETKQVLEMGADSVTGQKCTAEADMKDHPTVVEMDSTVVYELGA